MSSIGTFGSFTQARLGIYAAQKGMSVTGQNISNINTPGYTRQRLDQTSFYARGADRYYSSTDSKVGYGVLCTGVSQLRDPYLDIRFRGNMADVGFLGEKLENLSGIESILDEVGKGKDDFGVLGAQFSEIYKQLQQMIDQTGDANSDIQVRVASEALVKMFRSYASKLEEVKKNAEAEFEKDVQDINTILTKIRDLNTSIRKSEIHGDQALELRDERNMQIDKLSEYIKIDVSYVEEDLGGGQTVEKLVIKLGDTNPDGTVQTDSTTLIDGVYGGQFSRDYPRLNPAFDPTRPNEAGNEQYLDANNAPTINVDQAAKDKDPYLRLAVTDLRTADGKLLYDVQRGARQEVDIAGFANGKTTTVTDPDTGVITILTRVKEVLPKLLENPAFNPGLPASDQNPRYLGPKLNTGADKDTKPYMGPKLNPQFDPDAPRTAPNLPYVAKNGGFTDDPTQAVEEPTANKEEALRVPTNDQNEALWEVRYYTQTFTRTPSKMVALDDNDLHGSLQSLREFLTEQGEFTDRAVVDGVDENAATKRGVGYYQKSLDLLARQFATQLNDANHGWMHNEKGEYLGINGQVIPTTDYRPPVRCDVNGTPDPNGSYYQIDPAKGGGTIAIAEYEKIMDSVPQMKLNDAGALISCDKDGNPTAAGTHYLKSDGQVILQADYNQLKDAKTAAYDSLARGTAEELKGVNHPTADQEAYLEGKNVKHVGVNLFSTRGDTDSADGITASNISISRSWAKGTALVTSFVKPSKLDEVASTDSSNLLHILTLFTTKLDYTPTTIAPNADGTPMFNGSFQEMWDNIGSVLSEDISVTNTMLASSENIALDLDTQRFSVSSVDLNDEAMNLMQYSKSYNAACRLMTTLDSMLDKLINGTGITT